MFCSRLFVRHAGYSLLSAAVAAIALLLVPWLPPVNRLIRLLSGGESAGSIVPTATLSAVAALIVLTAATALVNRLR